MPKFELGKSGNPAGRPKGRLNQTTELARRMLTDAAPEILQTLIEQAKAGEASALKIVADRLLPSRRSMQPIALPDASTPDGCVKAIACLIEAVASGSVKAGEARHLATMLEAATALFDAPAKLAQLFDAVVKEVTDADPALQERVLTRLRALSATMAMP